jgi:outer membrane protein
MSNPGSILKLIRKAILMVGIVLTGQGAEAQNLKFGHINSTELIQSMPEFDSAQVKLEKLRKDLVAHLDMMSAEFNGKYDEYLKNSKSLSEIVRQIKEQELNDMNSRIQDFQSAVQSQLQEKQAEFFQPVYGKAEKAIKDTGKQNGFLYIFDTSQGGLLYFNETLSTDITTLVKAKLK